MSDYYCLNFVKASKPYYLLELTISGSLRQWTIPSRENLGLGNKKRIAFESCPEGLNTGNKGNGNGDRRKHEIVQLDTGRLIVISEHKNKMEFDIPEHGNTDFFGRYVFLVPSWGRNTYKKTWVLIPTEKK